MTYLKANDTKSERVIIPTSVGKEFYNGKEFPGMRGFCTIRKDERVFHLDRIIKLQIVA